jgi:hypothetical protein
LAIIALPIIAFAEESPRSTAIIYLSLWQSGDYSAMYDLLSGRSKQFISKSEFIDEYRDFARHYAIERYSTIETINLGRTAVVSYELTLTGIGIPSKYKRGSLNLVKEKGRWLIDR